MSENISYLVVGDNQYIKETEINKIRSKFLSSSEMDLNFSVYTPEEIEGVMDSLGTMPFLSERRVVLVKDITKIPDNTANTIVTYLENPSEVNVLILSADSSFKKTKHFREISKHINVIKADNPDAGKIKNWIRTFFKKNDISITSEAVDLIVEAKGTDTSGVKMELDKLLSFSGGDIIDAEHVKELVGRNVNDTVFDLVDAINARNSGRVFEVLNDLYEQKKQPQEVIGYLSWYIRVMQKISLLSSRGIPPGEMASELGYSPAYTRRLSAQSRKYPVERIDKWVSLLLDTDRDIKFGIKPPALAMEMLLVNLLKS